MAQVRKAGLAPARVVIPNVLEQGGHDKENGVADRERLAHGAQHDCCEADARVAQVVQRALGDGGVAAVGRDGVVLALVFLHGGVGKPCGQHEAGEGEGAEEAVERVAAGAAAQADGRGQVGHDDGGAGGAPLYEDGDDERYDNGDGDVARFLWVGLDLVGCVRL